MNAPLAPSPARQAAERHHRLTRRHFLRGLGACLALPAFESWSPLGALAAGPSAAPVRMAFCYVPNGTIPAAWWPEGNGGRDFALSRTLQPLAPVRHELQVLGGLNDVCADPGPDGAGDHARAGGTPGGAGGAPGGTSPRRGTPEDGQRQ